jgi:hypothetical protein
MIELTFQTLDAGQKLKFYNDLKSEILHSNDPAAVNMWDENWESNNKSLLFILNKRNRFNPPTGDYYIVYDGDKFAGSAGVYKADFCNEIAIAGVRAWIPKAYQNKGIIRNILLPAHREWAIKNNCKQVALSFNDYNKNMAEVFKGKRRLGESRPPKTERHMFYSGIESLNYPVTIQYTPQWVIYEKLDKNWEFDWSSLKL